jgi:Cytochrome c7 and related cytochrome c
LHLSNGAALTASLTPGQFVEVLAGQVQAKDQWRPPQDIEKRYLPAGQGRVNFSHERHFGTIGTKNCIICHADEKGLGRSDPRNSFAPTPALEPHGATSMGRFCEGCHNGNLNSTEIAADAKPPLRVTIFTSFGRTGDSSCQRCHTPPSHGADFTPVHNVIAGQSTASCAACHRGGREISVPELGQARSFVAAQLQILKNPEDTAAFAHTLPNHFCTYCHTTQIGFWKPRVTP